MEQLVHVLNLAKMFASENTLAYYARTSNRARRNFTFSRRNKLECTTLANMAKLTRQYWPRVKFFIEKRSSLLRAQRQRQVKTFYLTKTRTVLIINKFAAE